MQRICYFGTYERDYERNRLLMRSLRRLGVEVVECHAPLMDGMRHKTGSLGDRRSLAKWTVRLGRAWIELARRYRSLPRHDALFVGYLGHADVLLARALARSRGVPLVFDAFISLHDTLVGDRRVFREGSVAASALSRLDHLSCRLADRVLVDTEEHAEHFAKALGVPPRRLHVLPASADEEIFYPIASRRKRKEERFTLLHYGKHAPLHGVEHILDALSILQRREGMRCPRLLLVGGGQLDEEIDTKIAALGLHSVERVAWLEGGELRAAIAAADVCLGTFGTSKKAARVVPNKVHQCMAVGAPVVTADSPAIRRFLDHETSALLVPAGDGEAIAEAITRLRHDAELRRSLGENARSRFVSRGSEEVLQSGLRRLLLELESEVG